MAHLPQFTPKNLRPSLASSRQRRFHYPGLLRLVDGGEGGERLGVLEAISFSSELTTRQHEPEFTELIDAEMSLLEVWLVARAGQKARFTPRPQLGDEIIGLKVQQKVRDAQAC